MAATRLRTEVIVNLTVVVGAALVFSGVLLLWLAERELLAQQTHSHRRTAEAVAVALAGEADVTVMPTLAGRLLDTAGADGWYLFDSARNIVAAVDSAPFAPDLAALRQAQLTVDAVLHLDYRPGWLPHAADGSALLLTVPIRHPSGIFVLQVRFALNGIDAAMARARSFFLLFLTLYLVVLVGFGAWLLNRTVIRPVLELRRAATRISAGNLDEPVPVVGPAEIGELAGAFNGMMSSLAASRAETGASIRSLEETNAELRRTQVELIRSEKLASVGRLAAGMAHEIGNPLGAVVGYLSFLQAQLQPGSAEADILGRSQVELARIDHLVRDLLDYAAPARSDSSLCDPAAPAGEARDLLLHQGAFDAVAFRDLLPATLPPVQIDRHKLVQVIINLLLNARDAVGSGGGVELAGSCHDGWVSLAVRDNGPGIDAATQEQIFDPFFTTKAPGQGRGLGLAVCHRIVEEVGGRIVVESSAGAGSLFRVDLPVEGA